LVKLLIEEEKEESELVGVDGTLSDNVVEERESSEANGEPVGKKH
jgi:hypothetical protein